VFGGVRRGGAFDGRRVGDGAFVTHREPFAVTRLGAPDRADLYFPRFCGTVGLFACASGQFFDPHRNAGAVEAQVKGGRQRLFPQRPGVEPFIGGDFVAERFGVALNLTGVNANARQFPQQLAAFLETNHRTDGPHHADGGRRKAGLLDPQLSVTRVESTAAMPAMIVGSVQLEFAQDALNHLEPASGIASGLAASAS
jgi:hypothetical protein